MTEFTLNFGGFYESIHSDKIDVQIDLLGINWEAIDYKKTFTNYSISYLNKLSNYLDIDLDFVELDSPRFYNYRTDTIIAKINNKDFKKLKSIYLIDNDFVSFVNEESKSREGFTSFYNGIEEVKKESSMLLEYIFNYIFFTENQDLDFYDLEFEITENELTTKTENNEK